MELTLTTPAVLFSAISLLLLAYTNRFLAIAQLVRTLHDKYMAQKDARTLGQIRNLRKRVYLIRTMQITGMGSLLLCVVTMFLIYIRQMTAAELLFGLALVLLILSLAGSIWEIQISVRALDLHLCDMEDSCEDEQKTGRA
ncbi:MAG: DUF2721 domain-containing protein [Spirochaetes bacterium]|nr:MAG: DUF2721 domain-containing protein [Spirochaetota bacterium]